MSEIIYQKVFDEIQNDLPEGWTRMVFFVAYTEGSYSMKYYYRLDGEGYLDCFSQSGSKMSQLINKFMTIDKILSEERNMLPEEKRWTVMTMVVDANGSFKTEYDYCDVSENMITYERTWENRYLQ